MIVVKTDMKKRPTCCNECPIYCKEWKEKKFGAFQECPLMQIPSREEAGNIIHEWLTRSELDIYEILDKLGFKEGEKK